MEFKELGINKEILSALAEEGYTNPTPIQEKTIPAILAGNDILGLAQTGTGKTAAFAVPTLQILAKNPQNSKKRKIRSLVLTPTRELGTQVYESFQAYGRNLPLKSTVIFGGVSQGKQVTALRGGIDILVATPGRLIDLINQGYIDISKIEIFVLDEADRMLDMGFIHDIRKIVKMIPKKKQTLFFSATMPKEVVDIVDNLLVNPVEVSVAPVSSTVDTVNQYVQFVDQNHKIDLLTRFLRENSGEQVLVFTRTKRGADRVARDLEKRRISAQAIHGNKSQNARQGALDNFKSYVTQVLVATDIASRGIDINELNYVVNYDMPEVPETYVHRIGRTGRAGNSGTSISYVNFKDTELLRDIEKLIKKEITVLDNPDFPMVDLTEKAKTQRRKPERTKKAESKEPKRREGKDTQGKKNKFKPAGDKSTKYRRKKKKSTSNKGAGYKSSDYRKGSK